nr:MAG TPA: hypothetical protein [Caudoviricetes sp.]DAI92003.1 MAG TPA: hypothetical protein [Caudoviricetes sp.]
MAVRSIANSFRNNLLLYLEMAGQRTGSILAHFISDSVFHCRIFCSLSQNKGSH